MGIILLPQLYELVPEWLFFSVLFGWLAYVVVAIMALRSRWIAYPLAFVFHSHVGGFTASAGTLLVRGGRSLIGIRHFHCRFCSSSCPHNPDTDLALQEPIKESLVLGKNISKPKTVAQHFFTHLDLNRPLEEWHVVDECVKLTILTTRIHSSWQVSK